MIRDMDSRRLLTTLAEPGSEFAEKLEELREVVADIDDHRQPSPIVDEMVRATLKGRDPAEVLEDVMTGGRTQRVGQHADVHTEGYRRGGRRRKRELRAMRIINGPVLDMQREITLSRRRERRSA